VQSTQNIAWFADIGLDDRPGVGGKGGSLGELIRAGMDVPPGFVVRTEVFARFVRALDEKYPVYAAIEALDPADLDRVAAATAAVRGCIGNAALPDDIDREIRSAYATWCTNRSDPPVAVRSSATTEDAEDASFAGLQDTFLWIIGADQVVEMVRRCWASLYTVESVCYRRKRGLPEGGIAMGVVVQRMVDARTAGVMFTRSPTTGDRSVTTIEGAWGLGCAVVSGEVTPDRWVIAKLTDEITVRDISRKHLKQVPKAGGGIEDVEVPEDLQHMPSLSDDDLLALKEIGQRAEKHYGRPQDIEWAIERETDRIYLLQSRPETVWSVKEAAPVAARETAPHRHVMNIFGGRR
jgi:pyruvate,water dikinase